jgi:hypothetical protein
MNRYLTKYSNIFKCYWGNENSNSSFMEEIFENRNKFIKQYNITKYVGNKTYTGNLKIDKRYIEIYECENGDKIIVIHFHKIHNHGLKIFCINNNFEKYLSLYHYVCDTYIKILNAK